MLDVIKATTAVIYVRITAATHSLCHKTFLRPYITLAEPSIGVNTPLNLRHCQWRMVYGVGRKAPNFITSSTVVEPTWLPSSNLWKPGNEAGGPVGGKWVARRRWKERKGFVSVSNCTVDRFG